MSVNPNSSILAQLQTNIKSLVWQVSLIFLGLVVLLVVTGGHLPSSWLATYIIIGILYVTWDEYKRNFQYLELTENLIELAEQESNQQSQPLVTKDYQLAILRRSIREWNVWRQETTVEIHLSRVNLRGVNLSGADLSDAEFRSANLRGADISKANLQNADFRDAHLSRANFSRAHLEGSDFSEAYLTEANFSRSYLSETNFTRSHLNESNFLAADLSGANLSGAELSGANFMGTDLSGANLNEANLSGANLYRADLCGSNLLNSNLSEANLFGANLSEADLTRAVVEGTIFGKNSGLTEEDQVNLRVRGAILRNTPDSDVPVFTRR